MRETEPRPPSEKVDARAFGPELARRIDRDLDAIVLRALALDPDERFDSSSTAGGRTWRCRTRTVPSRSPTSCTTPRIPDA